MASPKRMPSKMIGKKLRTGPGVGIPNTPDRCPHWKTKVTAPSAASTLTT